MPIFQRTIASCLLSSAMILPAVAMDAPVAKLPAPLAESDFVQFAADKAELGQLLFYDKILSGNRNISCGTCHHHELGSADGLSLGVGEGGEGIGAIRTTGAGSTEVHERVPRNAPALWNLAHTGVTSVFHDGRLAVSDTHPSGFDGPAGDRMLIGLETIIAAQALFPPTSATEMAGQGEENDVALATQDGMHNVWPILAKRVADIPEYEQMFVAAFDNVEDKSDITYVEIANAIAAFVGTEFKNYDSPFDAYLAGDKTAVSDEQMRGMTLFFGDAGCSVTHTFLDSSVVIPATTSTLLLMVLFAMFSRIASWMMFELTGQWSTQEIHAAMMRFAY